LGLESCFGTSENWFSVSGFEKKNCEIEFDIKRAQTKPISKNWVATKKLLEYLGENLSKTKIVNAITILSEARKRRFLRSRRPKYGSMNKGFTEEELERFFKFCEDPKFKLMFSFQAVLGLRIGEAVRINVKDINLKTKELRIFTEKSGKTDYLLIPDQLFNSTLDFISAYEKEIADAKGFLFFSLKPGHRTRDTEPHIMTCAAREYFRVVCKKASLEEFYGYSYGKKPTALRRLTTHSLRHFAITTFCKRNGGNAVLASKFARHTNLQTTMTYIHTEREELYQSIRNAQEGGILEKVRKMQEKV
jgi:integrase